MGDRPLITDVAVSAVEPVSAQVSYKPFPGSVRSEPKQRSVPSHFVTQAPSVPARSQILEMALYGGAAVVVAVVLFTRFRLLGSIPGQGFVVEGALIDAATRLWEHGWTGLGPNSSYRQPPGLEYLMAPWIALFDDSIATARKLVAVLGIASIGLFFLLFRGLFGTRAAGLGSTLMAFGAWPMYFSRFSSPVVLLLLVELLVLYLMTKALDERRDGQRRRLLLVLSGISFGTGIYTHNAFFIFAVAVAFLWVREYIVAGPKYGAITRLTVVFLAPAIVVAIPYMFAMASSWDQVSANTARVWVTHTYEYRSLNGVDEQASHIVAGIGRAAVSLVLRRYAEGPDGSGVRLVDSVTALLAVIGLAVGAFRWHRRGHAMVWLLLIVSVIGVGMTTADGFYGRFVVLLPAVFAAAGFGIHWLLTWMRGRLSVAAHYVIVTLLIIIVANNNIGMLFDPDEGRSGDLWFGAGPREEPVNVHGD